MIDLRQEPEVFECDKGKPQILDGADYVQNAHLAVGFASRCWYTDGSFNTSEALRVVNEMCAYMRLLKDGKVT